VFVCHLNLQIRWHICKFIDFWGCSNYDGLEQSFQAYSFDGSYHFVVVHFDRGSLGRVERPPVHQPAFLERLAIIRRVHEGMQRVPEAQISVLNAGQVTQNGMALANRMQKRVKSCFNLIKKRDNILCVPDNFRHRWSESDTERWRSSTN
jgi:hypothetical protein